MEIRPGPLWTRNLADCANDRVAEAIVAGVFQGTDNMLDDVFHLESPLHAKPR